MTERAKPELVLPADSVRYSYSWTLRDSTGSMVLDLHGIDSLSAIPVPRVGETVEVVKETGGIFGGTVTKVENTVHLYEGPPPSALYLIHIVMM